MCEVTIQLLIKNIVLFLPFLIFFGAPGCNKNNLTFPPPVSFPIEGIVVDSTTNVPVPFALVQLGPATVKTLPNGTYSIPGSQIQSGTYTMKIVADGYYTPSKLVQVISDTTQIVNFSIQAIQDTIDLNSSIAPGSYFSQSFNFDAFPFIQCSNGKVNHDVKITFEINSTTNPVYSVVVAPDGSYQFERSSIELPFEGVLRSNLCGDWAVAIYDSGAAPATFSGKIILDFSNYPISGDSGTASVMVPFNYPSIATDSSASFSRFLETNISYQLRFAIVGSSDNNIDLTIRGPGSNTLFDQLVNGNYVSPNFVAAKDGFYTFEFSNKLPISSTNSVSTASSVASSKSVSGTLVISR